MSSLIAIKTCIEDIFKISRFAVLATEGNGQPHVSLVAITPHVNYRQLVFATYRNSLKYRNIKYNSKVAVLIENGDANEKDLKEGVVLTIIGHTEELSKTGNEDICRAHLKRHPGMESFILSKDCALIKVIAHSYQLVKGVDDISWITADELDAC